MRFSIPPSDIVDQLKLETDRAGFVSDDVFFEATTNPDFALEVEEIQRLNTLFADEWPSKYEATVTIASDDLKVFTEYTSIEDIPDSFVYRTTISKLIFERGAEPDDGRPSITDGFDAEQCKKDIESGKLAHHYDLALKVTTESAREMADFVEVKYTANQNERLIAWRVFVKLLGEEAAANRILEYWKSQGNIAVADMRKATSSPAMYEIARGLKVQHATNKGEAINARLIRNSF